MTTQSFKTLRNSRNPVTLQCTFYDRNGITEFAGLLSLLSRHGFYGIELNLPDLEALPAGDLRGLLRAYDLSLTYIATGIYARRRGLSLSSADPEVRQKSIEGCMENIRYASDLGAGIIIGYLKNHPEPDNTGADQADTVLYLAESLQKLDCFARTQGVPMLLEATNRYESSVANSLCDTHQIIELTGGSMISILPDTYHMNIEESHPLEALSIYQSCYQNIHLSDNNRYFPGLGCLDFESYLRRLNAIHYQGTFGIEGILKNGITEDLEVCAEYLSRVMGSAAQTDGAEPRGEDEDSASAGQARKAEIA